MKRNENDDDRRVAACCELRDLSTKASLDLLNQRSLLLFHFLVLFPFLVLFSVPVLPIFSFLFFVFPCFRPVFLCCSLFLLTFHWSSCLSTCVSLAQTFRAWHDE